MAKEISSGTTIKELLSENKETTIGALVKLNSNFSKLRNPVLRNLMGRRVTIADACKVAGCSVNDFMDVMHGLGFVVGDNKTAEMPNVTSLTAIEVNNYVELDVRPLLDKNIDPLKTILNAINNLKANEGLKLINSFEPAPVIHLLNQRGFTNRVVKPDGQTVITYFNPTSATAKAAMSLHENDVAADAEAFDQALRQFRKEDVKYIDVRGLDMPAPMVAILENVRELKKGEALFVYHKKRPLFLLPELENRGYKYLFKDIAEGNVNILIFKP